MSRGVGASSLYRLFSSRFREGCAIGQGGFISIELDCIDWVKHRLLRVA